jgi:hypothetical protein
MQCWHVILARVPRYLIWVIIFMELHTVHHLGGVKEDASLGYDVLGNCLLQLRRHFHHFSVGFDINKVVMRLINTSTLEIHEFPGDSDKQYAILSHTWDEEECTFQDMSSPSVKLKKGFAKIEFCCKQAAQDSLEWAWIDTLVQL